MPRYTNRWGLSILGPGDSIQADGYKFADADRRPRSPHVRHRRSPAHRQRRHRNPRRGSPCSADHRWLIPASAHYYRYTVVDAAGNESAGSPIQFLDTPAAVSPPGAVAAVTGTGDLMPGTYLSPSARTKPSSLETKALNLGHQDPRHQHPQLSADHPARPADRSERTRAYRRAPSGMHYLWLTRSRRPPTRSGSTTASKATDRSLPEEPHQ
jgi:hypothetical protein